MLDLLKYELLKLKDLKRAKLLSGYFKTKKGEYAEGDIFLGLTVPISRKIAKKYKTLKLKDIRVLLKDKIHEYRLVGLFILVDKFQRGDDVTKKKIAEFYLKNKNGINNWDLVDLSAPRILGEYYFDKNKSIFYKLARSKNIWDKRIAVLSTFTFIKNNNFVDSLKIAEILINDKHDLIHKAVGWMLREVGKKDLKMEEGFLKKYYKKMPRTMLRYAIEKFPKTKRNFYLQH